MPQYKFAARKSKAVVRFFILTLILLYSLDYENVRAVARSDLGERKLQKVVSSAA
jgi:hypothetical protein